MNRLLLLLLIFYTLLNASEYPETFSTLGTPLYKSVKPISKFVEIKELEDKILTFEQHAGKALSNGFKVDKSKDRAEIKEYLFELRRLQKSYDYLLHIVHKSIDKAIESNNYELFLKLTRYEFDGLLKNSNLREKSIEFYNANKSKRRIKTLDKKIERKQLIAQTSQEFYNKVVESSYDSNSKADTTKTVFMETKRSGNYIDVFVINRNFYDVTVKIKAKYKNIIQMQNRPEVVVVKANSTLNYTKLRLGKGSMHYSFNFSWIIGSIHAVHDDSYLYRLPFATGTACRVSQGFDTAQTHKENSKYAVDFAMEEGTKIYAAREGVVVKTKSDSNIGGYAKEFAKDGNFVTVLHNDGTFGTYYHLKQFGVLVKEGDFVQRGLPLGYSGNTGFSSGPHLHFSVFKAISATATHTIAVKFIGKNGVISEPNRGVAYEAK